jgi:transketolase
MTNPELSKLNENQAYAKAIEYEKFFELFRDMREVFQKAAAARKLTVDINRENKPLVEENIKLKEKKKQIEKEIVDITASREEKRKELDHDESAQRVLHREKLAKWNKTITDKKEEYERLITAKSKELNDIVKAKTKEVEEKEKRNAILDKEYNDVMKLFVPVGS